MSLFWQNQNTTPASAMPNNLSTSSLSTDAQTAFGMGLGLGLGLGMGGIFQMPQASGDTFQGWGASGLNDTPGMDGLGIPSSTLMLMSSIQNLISSVLADIQQFLSQLLANEQQWQQQQSSNSQLGLYSQPTQNGMQWDRGSRSDIVSARGNSNGSGNGAAGWAEDQLGKSEADKSWMNFVTNGRPGDQWCAHFVSKAFEESGGSPWGHIASVSGILQWAKENDRFIPKSNGAPQVGDVVIFKNNRSHTGIVTKVNPDGSFETIEGNSSNKVARRNYSANESTLTGFVRP